MDYNSSMSPQSIDGRSRQGSRQGSPGQKPRLTETEKKQNHISSEQKRRQAIRGEFDQICKAIPGLEEQGRSEGLVLNETTSLIYEAIEQRKDLVRRCLDCGIAVPEELLEVSNIDLELVDKQYFPETPMARFPGDQPRRRQANGGQLNSNGLKGNEANGGQANGGSFKRPSP